MSIFLQTHIAKHGETLEQIAAMYNIPDVEILKHHHYQNVPKNANHLGITLLHGQEIFIPDRKEIENIIAAKKSRLDAKNNQVNSFIENNILLPVFPKVDTHYKVSVKDFTDDILKNETAFEVHLKYLGKKEQYYIFSYHKKIQSVNGEQPDLKVYELALECTEHLFPAALEIDERGKIGNINNYRDILNRWKNNRQNLLQKYHNSGSLEYIDDVNDTMDVREELIEVFCQDVLLQFIFAPYFKQFNQGNTEINEKLSEDRILYQSQYFVGVNEEIYVNQHSQCIDARSQQEIINNVKTSTLEHHEDELLHSEITADYTISKDTKIVQTAEIKIESFLFQVLERTQIKIDIK